MKLPAEVDSRVDAQKVLTFIDRTAPAINVAIGEREIEIMMRSYRTTGVVQVWIPRDLLYDPLVMSLTNSRKVALKILNDIAKHGGYNEQGDEKGD